MTLVEAIKSGRPFARPDWQWVEVAANADGFWFVKDKSPCSISRASDISADDWMTREPAVLISTKMFWSAVHAVLLECDEQPYEWTKRMAELATKLGLSPTW